MATTSADSTIKVWSTADFQLRNTLKRGQEKWVWDCAFAQDSQHLFTGWSRGKGEWSRGKGEWSHGKGEWSHGKGEWSHGKGEWYCVCWSVPVTVLGCVLTSNPASSDHKARLWNVDQASAIRDFSGHQKAVVALAYRE